MKKSSTIKLSLKLYSCDFNTVCHNKDTTSRLENYEFQIFCSWVIGPYE